MEQFQIGDVVYLKSGSPAMTIVNEPLEKQYTVAWIDSKEKENRKVYPYEALTKNDPNNVPPPLGKII